MVKVRLKEEVGFPKLVTRYGIITRDWKEIPEGSYIFDELEVYGDPKTEKVIEPKVVEEPKAEEPVEEAKVEPVEEVPVEKPKVKKKPKKKKKWL